MNKIIALFLLLSLLLSCTKKVEVTIVNDKKDFLIQVKPLKSLWSNSFLIKSWKIQWKDDIKLSSQAIWRVWKVLVKEGDKVKVWQNLVFLNDTIANYSINIEKSSNLIDKMQISYDSTKVSLDKQIFDLEISLEKLNNSYETLKTTSSIDISQAEDNLSNTDYSWMDTKSSLELQKLDNSIWKADLDYNNALITNKETVETFKNNLKKEYLTQKIFVDDIITFWDKLFNISWLYEDDVKKFSDFFWSKDIVLKSNTKQLLIDLIKIKDDKINSMNFDNISEEIVLKYIEIIDSNYSYIDKYLSSLEKTINNSQISVWQLSQSQIDAYISTTNAYQTQLSINNATFLAYKNSSSSFLRTYKNTENSLSKQLELLNKDHEIFVKNYDLGSTQSKNVLSKVESSSVDNLKSLELQIKQTEESLRTSKESRDLTLKWLENSMSDAYIAQEVAVKDYDKLNIKASIDWVVWDIFIDWWQDVNVWTPILSIISDKASEAELYFKEPELEYISVWDKVTTKIWEKALTWTIYSVSSISDDSLNYKVLAVFWEKIQNLWWVIDVTIPVKSKSLLIPIKNVSLVWTNKWIISIIENWKIMKKEVLLWKMYKDNIEFLSFLDWTKLTDLTSLVISDVSNFDETKFNLKIEQ